MDEINAPFAITKSIKIMGSYLNIISSLGHNSFYEYIAWIITNFLHIAQETQGECVNTTYQKVLTNNNSLLIYKCYAHTCKIGGALKITISETSGFLKR